MDELRAICARLTGNELVAAECAQLTGGLPDADGVAVCRRVDGVPRAAFVRAGLRCYAEAATLAGLAEQIGRAAFEAEGFHIDFLPLAAGSAISKQQAVVSAADAIQTYPDLRRPRHRFLVVAQENRLWFGEILSECAHTYNQHDAKPFRTSSSLPSRLARALVNLVCPPPGGAGFTILDPFCGSGSILLEAQAVGAAALGMDRNFKMTGMSRRNLAHFGYQGTVISGDALDCTLQADAVVTDLPYGRLLQDPLAESNRAALQAALARLVRLAPLAVYLSEQDISPLLTEAGYGDIRVWRVRKHAHMSRFVHQARSLAL